MVRAWVDEVMRDTDAFFTPPPTRDYEFIAADAATRERGEAGTLRFPSALVTPHATNNVVHGTAFKAGDKRRAVVVLPQWNSNAEGHIGLTRLFAKVGITALRLSLPYHDVRMPPELARADFIVSSNIVRTLQACRQAVLDARRALWWLRDQGHERLGMVGTSLGSCLAMLTSTHEPLVRVQALNHVSPFFADVVWRGLSTAHVRRGLDGHVDLDELRELWRPISPWSCLERSRGKRTLLSMRSRPDLPGGSVGEAGGRVRAAHDPDRGRGAAVRSLQHGEGPIQVPRRLLSRSVPAQELVTWALRPRMGTVPFGPFRPRFSAFGAGV